jgi:hypothetical protein
MTLAPVLLIENFIYVDKPFPLPVLRLQIKLGRFTDYKVFST